MELEKVSYSLGVNIGMNLKSQGLKEVNPEQFATALNDVFAGVDLKMNEEEATACLNDYFMSIQEDLHKVNKDAGIAFLAVNKEKEGVITLESGLQYEVITEGNGDMPKATDNVTTHYHGTTIDGEVFDSSVERNEPATFPVNGVIAGWIEALQLMPVGSKWKLFVPSELAYGVQGAGPKIAPYSTLIFEVELLKIG